MERWRRWRRLRANDRREALRAAMLVVLSELGVRLFGLKRTRDWLRPPMVTGSATPESAVLARVTEAIERVRCHSPLAGTCLSRSLALEYLLSRRGIRSNLRIGARRSGGAVSGHAWVEVNGRPVNDTPDVHREFTPLK
jgi:hypothetical protein